MKYTTVRIDPILADRIRRHVRLLQSKGKVLTIKDWVGNACNAKLEKKDEKLHNM